MANFVFNPKWGSGVRQLETSDPVVAGPDGVDNIAPRQLSERTDFLKAFLDNQYGEIHNADGTPKSGVILPVSQGGTGLSTSNNGQFLRGNAAGGYSHVSPKDVIDQLKLIAFYDIAPNSNVNPVIYVLGKGFMEWQTIGSWSGYATLMIGHPLADSTPIARSMTIDAIGGTYTKSTYPGLWAWAQASGHVVGTASWAVRIFKFVDLGGNNFKVPDLRNSSIRFTGVDADNANARLLGSYQVQAVQQLSVRNQVSHRPINETFAPRLNSGSNTWPLGLSMAALHGTEVTITDNPGVVGSGTDTRPANTAFAPRIIAF